MIIKKIAAVCRNSGTLATAYDADGTLWISNGNAAYAVMDMPEMSAAQVMEMFDYTDKIRKTISTGTFSTGSRTFSAEYPGDTPLSGAMRTNMLGINVRIYRYNGRLLFIPDELFEPFERDASIQLYARTVSGQTVVVAKNLLMAAVLYPLKMGRDTLQRWQDNTAHIMAAISDEYTRIYCENADDDVGQHTLNDTDEDGGEK